MDYQVGELVQDSFREIGPSFSTQAEAERLIDRLAFAHDRESRVESVVCYACGCPAILGHGDSFASPTISVCPEHGVP